MQAHDYTRIAQAVGRAAAFVKDEQGLLGVGTVIAHLAADFSFQDHSFDAVAFRAEADRSYAAEVEQLERRNKALAVFANLKRAEVQ
jgi:hypothetical protein